MTGRELLRALMAREKTNPNKLQVDLRVRGLQSALARFLSGEIREPRMATMQPVLKRYGIELVDLIDATRATATAQRLGLGTEEEPATVAHTISAPPAPAYLADRRRTTLPQMIIEMGAELRKLDPATLAKMRTHLQSLAEAPENADLIAALVERSMGGPANPAVMAGGLPKSTF